MRIQCCQDSVGRNGSLFSIGDGFWGDWKTPQYCPDGFMVTGVATKWSGSINSGDDIAVTGIRVRCRAWATGFKKKTTNEAKQNKNRKENESQSREGGRA